MFLAFKLFYHKIETKPNLLKSTFADVYGEGYTPTNYTGPEYTETVTPTETDVYVHDSVFLYCSSGSDGGALYCSGSVLRLLVEHHHSFLV